MYELSCSPTDLRGVRTTLTIADSPQSGSVELGVKEYSWSFPTSPGGRFSHRMYAVLPHSPQSFSSNKPRHDAWNYGSIFLITPTCWLRFANAKVLTTR